MTDLIKGLNQTDSKQVIRYLRADPEQMVVQITRFRQELAGIGAVSPLLLIFGSDA